MSRSATARQHRPRHLRRSRPRSRQPRRLAALVALVAVLGGVLVTLAGAGLGPASRASAAPAARYDDAAAQRFVEQYTRRHGLPGAAYVVVRDGLPVTSGGTGTITASTPLSVGSISKSITAFAVLQLVDDGSVILDAPVTDHLPGFTIRGAGAEAITVRMLLDHTSGLPNPVLFDPTGSLEGDVSSLSALSLASRPGETYRYSNLNYRVLALLVQVVSGQEFGEYLQDKIFTPLGMNDSTSVITVSRRPGLDAGHVTGWGSALPLPELAASVGGAGGVISTADDLGAWLAMQQRGGVGPDGTRLLSADLVAQSHTRQPNAGTYGLGWQHTSTADPARVGHDGSLTRYSGRQDLVPSNGYGVAVLLDSYTPTYQHPFSISTGLIDLSEGRQPALGAPVATIIDLALGAVTLLVAALGVRGVRRATPWSRRRAHHGPVRRVLRLAPQAVLPALAVVVFVGLTSGRGNTATPVDAFGLWPAAMTLLLVGAVVGIVMIIVRVRAFRRIRARA